MKATLDTNVLISATFWSGDSDRIITFLENSKFELILSQEILDEYKKVLEYDEIKLKSNNLISKYPVEKFHLLATIVKPSQKVFIIKDDPDDNKVLECAKAGDVQFIVSQDKHLLKLKSFEKIAIVTPQEFLHILDG